MGRSKARSSSSPGGGTGLGRAAAAELLACGARVVICRAARGGAREAAARARRARSVAGDVRSPADAERIVDACLERHGRLDVLVNNAGGQYFVPAEAIAPKGWRAVTRLNVGGTELMTRTAAELRDAPGGRRHDHQRHALPAPRPRGHDALERGPRRGRGLHARARARVGAGRHRRDRARRRPLRHGVAAQVPRAGLARRGPHRPAAAASAARRSTPGSSRSPPPRSAARSRARSSRSTAPATTGSALAAAVTDRRRRRGADRGAPRAPATG